MLVKGKPHRKAGTQWACIYSAGQNHITFQNIAVTNSNDFGAQFSRATYNVLDGVDASWNYQKGVDNNGGVSDFTNHITVKDGEFSYNGFAGIEFHGGATWGLIGDLLIQNNTVHDNGIVCGLLQRRYLCPQNNLLLCVPSVNSYFDPIK